MFEPGVCRRFVSELVTELNSPSSVSGDSCLFTHDRVTILVTIYAFQGLGLEALHGLVWLIIQHWVVNHRAVVQDGANDSPVDGCQFGFREA